MTEIKMIRIDPRCDECGARSTNGMTFHRSINLADGSAAWEQYSLCNAHLPETPRVTIWTRRLRVGREIARRLGLGEGYGGCFACSTPWDCAPHHVTDYDESSGCFPLCEECWSEMTPGQRLPYYEAMVDEWVSLWKEDYGKTTWEELRRKIRNAVLAGG
jgi:hypothetical protein